ncbi:SEL1-like repeat protein [Amphritea sp. 2_MG-2023]|uniref:tetratricopeptide repeat protein n=1 Tax=Amphritea TaxID=515417 RepID=UPI001C06FBAD|nr:MULTISPECIES: SEL1-like repeat protein [Amphritea]MBU2965406.1 SEL1-like repeat protein [Amphritea atlantica]MDO6420696.1 SEL1-like repeat protein [Amphritea sp. 2_MG-2023]
MRLLMTLIAPLLGWIAFRLFHLSFMKGSRAKHQLVMKLFRYAADYGSVRALSVYGHLLFFRGEGMTNRIQGLIYLERAADKGDSKAAYQLGKVFEEGYSTYPADPVKAVKYYRQAAESGHILAIKRMVDICTNGELEQAQSGADAASWLAKLEAENV